MTQVVIILGAARSGTKYLRDILATASNASCVPHDINYVWRFGSESHPDDALPSSILTPKKKAFIRKEIMRLAGVKPNADTIVFEKTVGSTLRVEFVNSVFPDAKFIHLIRDGRAVTESAVRQWQEPVDYRRLIDKAKSLSIRNFGYAAWFLANVLRGKLVGRGGGRVWGPRYPGVDDDIDSGRDLLEICAKQWRFSINSTLDGLEAVPKESQLTVRYESLVHDEESLKQLIAFSALENSASIMSAHRARVSATEDDKWKRAFSRSEMDIIEPILNPTLERLGYTKGWVRNDY